MTTTTPKRRVTKWRDHWRIFPQKKQTQIIIILLSQKKHSKINYKLRHIVLRFRLWLAYQTYIRAEHHSTYAKLAHEKSAERMFKRLQRVRETRRIHESLKNRLTQNTTTWGMCPKEDDHE